MYDAANQLIRENLYYGSGNSNNATYTYGYDNWGNILSKSKYAYTTGTLGTIQSIISYYGYGSSQWKDQLTSYNGKSITYDASGNPTNYLGAALVWEGQQLKSYTPENTGSGRVNTYTYNYDENGLRTRKTIGSTVTDYYYNGTLLIGIVKTTTNSSGTTTSMQRFSYDADGKVIGVNYNGTYYYYLRNAQGDIVKLIDKNGNAAVEYTYDTWGKLLSTSGSLAYTLGKNNPFRYRGYIYDEETGFYYLQSRYYDPEVRRFISADVYLSTGQDVLGHNAYAYCLNNPVNFVDSTGHDAVVLYDENLPGHIGIMVQDADGVWWHFYWGTKKEDRTWRLAFGNVTAYTWCVRYDSAVDLNSINETGQFSGKYDHIQYLYGDFSSCIDQMKNPSGEYNLYKNNCSQVSLRILSNADTIYSDALSRAAEKTLPSFAYFTLKRNLPHTTGWLDRATPNTRQLHMISLAY